MHHLWKKYLKNINNPIYFLASLRRSWNSRKTIIRRWICPSKLTENHALLMSVLILCSIGVSCCSPSNWLGLIFYQAIYTRSFKPFRTSQLHRSKDDLHFRRRHSQGLIFPCLFNVPFETCVIWQCHGDLSAVWVSSGHISLVIVWRTLYCLTRNPSTRLNWKATVLPFEWCP